MGEQEKLSDYNYTKVPTLKKNNEYTYGFGVRHTQLVIFFLCLTVNLVSRGHMGVTMVAMTTDLEQSIATVNTTQYLKTNDNGFLNQLNSNQSENESKTTALVRNGSENNLFTSSTLKYQTWCWPKSVQEVVLNAFFFGYMIMMFPMGILCQRYGGKIPLQISLFVNGIVSILTPWLTAWGDWKGICCCRILQGLSQAGTYPSIQSLLAKWVPEEERATLGNCVHAGLTVGTVVGFQLAGFLGASKWGWPSTFYAVGLICLTCFILLTAFGASNPLEHKTIRDEEKNYIMRAAYKGNNKKLKTPWLKILVSKHVWATITTDVGSNITFVLFFNQVPTYIHYIFNIDVKNSGLLSSLPYMAATFTVILFGWLAGYAVNNNIVSKKNGRRISNSIASFGVSICLILTSYTSNPAVAVACLVAAMSAHMGLKTGWMVNYIDLAPNFAATLVAIGNTVGNFFIILTPFVVSHVVTDMTNITQWRTIFFIAAGVSTAANAIFVLLISADVQSFNYDDEDWHIKDQENKEMMKEIKSVELL